MLLAVAQVVEDSTPFHLSRQLIVGVCHTHYAPGFAAAADAQTGFPVAAVGLGNEFL